MKLALARSVLRAAAMLILVAENEEITEGAMADTVHVPDNY